MSYTNVIYLTTMETNVQRLERYFRESGMVQCNVFGVGDVWRDGVLAPMTEEFAAEMLAMIEAPSVPATFNDVDGPCDCCTKDSNCCLREGHHGDCNTSMAESVSGMLSSFTSPRTWWDL